MSWLDAIARMFDARAPKPNEADGLEGGLFSDHGLPLVPLDSIRRTGRSYPRDNMGYEVLKKKRALVQRQMTKEIDDLLKPLAYERTDSEWRKASHYGLSCFRFQKIHHGFECSFIAGTLGTLQVPSRTLANTRDGIQCFGIETFCPELPHNDVEGALPYVRLHDDSALRNAVMTVFRARMIPWMEARHTVSSITRMPKPADMARVRVFSDAPPSK